MTSGHYDVAIIGCGPAGAAAACLLGAYRLRVLIVDRATAVYDKPRAFALDHEIMRVFQNLGLAEAIAPHLAPFSASEHYGVDGQLIRRLTMIEPPYPLGWTPSMVFRQPPLEAALRAKVRATAGVEMVLGEALLAFTQDADRVLLTLARQGVNPGSTGAADHLGDAGSPAGSPVERTVTAKYLIGCDGASSTVRRILNIDHDDLDFDEPWLVVDVGVNQRGAAKCPKSSAQFCQPARPTTFLIGVGEHRRWEIMLLPGETAQQFDDDAAVWALLARWITPADGVLWRRASYRFHALVAREWRRNRVFLAGDAAHQQPPFLGQGMCQGIRDVANLSWKLAAVLRGAAGDALLDTYGSERAPHVKRLTATIKHIGHTICERDEARARQRDADLLAAAGGVVKSVPRQDLMPPLEAGLLSPVPQLADGSSSVPHSPSPPHSPSARGTLFPQPRILQGGASVLLDDIVGTGLRLMRQSGGAIDQANARRAADVCGAALVSIGAPAGVAANPASSTAAHQEQDGIVAAWFARFGAGAALVRPDHYVYGVASTPEQLTTLAASYRAALRV